MDIQQIRKEQEMKIRMIITSRAEGARATVVERIGEVEEIMKWKATYEKHFLNGDLVELNIDIERR